MGTSGRRKRRTFTDEFKRNAVNLVVKEGYSMSAAAIAVGVSANSIRQWCDKHAPEPAPRPPEVTLEQLQEENRRLRKELEQAALEREILKKATAYFAKESR